MPDLGRERDRERGRERGAGGAAHRARTLTVPALLLATVLLGSPAHAERGVFAASLFAGQAASVAPEPGAGRGVPIVAGLAYGLSERWSAGAALGAELTVEPTLSLSLGPRATLFRTMWWTIEALLVPEALLTLKRVDLGLRLGVTVRYQLMWGLGVGIEASVRGRTPALGAFAPSLQGLVFGGLYIEA